MAATQIPSTGTSVRALVAGGGDYTGETYPFDPNPAITLARDLVAPLLLLHGTADETAPVEGARASEAALQRHGKTYEVLYYDGFGHEDVPVAPPQAIAFLRKHLGA